MKRTMTLILSLITVFMLVGCSGSTSDYDKALDYINSGGYEGAIPILEQLGDYENCAQLLSEARNEVDYRKALELYAADDLAGAKELFARLGDYKSSAKCLRKLEDAALFEKLVGIWVSEPIDVTEQYMAQLTSQGFEDVDFTDAGRLVACYEYELRADGTVRIALEAEQLSAFTQKLIELYRGYLLITAESELYIAAEQNGLTVDDILFYYQLDSVAAYLEQELGMPLDTFCEQLSDQLTQQLQYSAVIHGAFSVTDGKLTLHTGEDAEEGLFDADADTLTLTGEGLPADKTANYPLVLTRMK